MMAAIQPQPTTQQSPYIGPRPFTREDVRLGFDLYGRDWEVDQLTDLLIGKRIVLLHAPSGAGKTSLIQAKLLPRFESEEFDVLPVIRVGLEPEEPHGNANRYLLSTFRSLNAAQSGERSVPADAPPLDLATMLDERRDVDGKPQLLIFDQFEEILTADPTDREAKEAFFAQVGAALRNRDRWALFAMREDYVAALEPFVWAIPTRLTTTFRLDFLGIEAAADAIRRPAETQAGVSFTQDAVDQLLNDLRRVRVQRADGPPEERFGPYVEPVQLQVVCLRLWEKLPPGIREITAGHLSGAGQVDTALGDYFAEQVRATAEETGVGERRIRAWFEDSLIAGGIRWQVLKGAEESGGLSNHAVQRLEDAHLVRGEERGGRILFELTHDRLIRPILADNARWREENLNLVQRGAALWEGEGRPSSLLLEGPELAEAASWAKQHADELLDAERDYLAESRETQNRLERDRRTTRWIRVLAIVATITAVLAVLFAISAANNKAEADEQRVLAQAHAVQSDAARALAVEREEETRRMKVNIEEMSRQSAALAERASALQIAQQVRAFRESRLDLTLLLGLEVTRRAVGTELTRGLLGLVVADPHLIGFVPAHQDWVRSLAFSPDGKRLASSSSDQTIMLWSGGAIMPLTAPLTGHRSGVYTVVFSPDGKSLASASGDGNVMIWDLTADQPVGRTIGSHLGGAFGVAFSPDGQRLVSGGADRTVRVWAVPSDGPLLASGVVHTDAIYRVAFSPDGALIASGGRDRQVVLWDASSLEQRGALADPDQGAVYGMAFSPDGKLLVTGASDSAINVWDVAQRSRVGRPMTEHKGSVFDVAFNKDGTRLASAGADKRVLLWDNAGGQLKLSETRLTGFQDKVYSVAFSPTRGELVSGSASGTIARWDLQGKQTLGAPLSAADSDDVYDVAFSPTENAVVAWTTRRDVTLEHDIEGLYQSTELKAPNGVRLNAIAFNPAGTLLAAGGTKTADSVQGRVVLWDVKTAKLADPPGFDLPLKAQALAFSPDGVMLAVGGCSKAIETACTAGDVRLWDVRNHRAIDPPLVGHTREILSVAFSPDGTLLATGGEDSWILLWDVATRTLLGALPEGHRERVLTLAFSPDGQLLASGSQDSNIILWNVKERRAIGRTPALHTAGVARVAFSPDGTMLASGSYDGTIVLWDTTSRLPLGQLPAEHQGWITSLAFSRDGGMLVSSAEGQGSERVIRWDISGDRWRARACELAGRNLTDEEWRLYVGAGPPQASCPHPLLLRAVQEALRGERAAAEATLVQVVDSTSDLDDFRLHSSICWYGSLEGFPAAVLPACERAHAVAPRWLGDWTRDNLGLARARNGDLANAASDFRDFVAWARKARMEEITDEMIAERERWIAVLDAGQDPFDAKTIRELRLE